jgi:hypothetical protein
MQGRRGEGGGIALSVNDAIRQAECVHVALDCLQLVLLGEEIEEVEVLFAGTQTR